MKSLKNPVIALLYLIMVILKLDGKTDISWFIIFAPILIDLSTEVFVEVAGSVYNFIANMTKAINANQERYSGQKCYWDAANNRMYVPFETDNNVSE